MESNCNIQVSKLLTSTVEHNVFTANKFKGLMVTCSSMHACLVRADNEGAEGTLCGLTEHACCGVM